MIYTITLALPNQPRRTVIQVDADSPAAAAAVVAKRFPFLPPMHVWVDETPLLVLRLATASHRPAAPSKPLTEGQRAHAARIKRQRHAERWRQHWIDKDNAKRHA